MSIEISAQERKATAYVGLPVSAHLSEFGAPGGPNEKIPRVYQWLAEHGVSPLGGPMYIYRHLDEHRHDPADLTVGVPIAEPVVPTSGLVFDTLPEGTYIVGRHVGSPDTISASIRQVREWAEVHRYLLPMTQRHKGTLWTGFVEHFLTDPSEEPDPSKWITELLFKTA
ncbi:GyrI-like domain-containing protein [Nesterenkonia ebinurensis]|uniref:GyrI-like domain-containing protein n=1 Tax=Nesterenkonia ebinurensis TaxID=2608252 RepID=UPI00123DC0C2|nr:GyrI-like domain-containing protein [Nesterenkonia ebinurensis]